jgi:hypothetical protein
VLPAPEKKPASVASRASDPAPAAKQSARPSTGPFARKPIQPIGPAAMKALREAIRSGRYPSDAAVIGGLTRMLKKPQ